MNLKEGRGLVPIKNKNPNSNAPYLLVEFPTPVVFRSLYRNSITDATLEKYREIFQVRMLGGTLEEAGKHHGISRERVRQIEAKFLRAMERRYAQTSEPFSIPDLL
jgi:hypothetical protein